MSISNRCNEKTPLVRISRKAKIANYSYQNWFGSQQKLKWIHRDSRKYSSPTTTSPPKTFSRQLQTKSGTKSWRWACSKYNWSATKLAALSWSTRKVRIGDCRTTREMPTVTWDWKITCPLTSRSTLSSPLAITRATAIRPKVTSNTNHINK